MIERLQRLDVPDSFRVSRRTAASSLEGLKREKLSLGSLERKKLHLTIDVLTHPELQELIKENKITLGIIKPFAHKGKDLPANDQKAADFLLSQIEDKAVFNINLKLSKRHAKEFYAPLREKLSTKLSENGKGTIWDSLTDYASSGPLTFVLIYKEDGNAVEWWRDKIGHTVADRAGKDSIRGKYAITANLPNNLVHGSDSIESVSREVGILSEIVTDIAEKADENAKKFPKEKTLQELEILPADNKLVSLKTIYECAGSDGWTYGYEIKSKDERGRFFKSYLKEKNIIDEEEDSWSSANLQVERGRFLEALGVPVPRIYGAKDHHLYQEFIKNNNLTDELERIKRGELSEVKDSLDQLKFIAQVLDDYKFKSIGFVRDLIYVKDSKKFFYVDYGFELSQRGELKSNYNLDHLARMFPKFKEYILKAKQK